MPRRSKKHLLAASDTNSVQPSLGPACTRHKPAPGGPGVGGHHLHLPTAHGLVEKTGRAHLVMAEAEYETGATLGTQRTTGRQMRLPRFSVGINFIPNKCDCLGNQAGQLPSWLLEKLVPCTSPGNSCPLFSTYSLGLAWEARGAWNFTHQPLLWKPQCCIATLTSVLTLSGTSWKAGANTGFH